MTAKVSVKGQMVIPEFVREQARIVAGDELDVGCANGLVILRKRLPMTPSRVRSLILAGRGLDEITTKDEAVVAEAVKRVRSQNMR